MFPFLPPEQSAAVRLARREPEFYVDIAQQSGRKEEAMDGNTGHEMAWKVDGNHVVPVDDLREHSVTDCWCCPTDDDGIMVHNSLDGREQYERGERKVS